MTDRNILASVDFSGDMHALLERVPSDMLTGVRLAKSFSGRVAALKSVAQHLRPENSVLADRIDQQLQKEVPNGVLGLFF